jgi:hypothetical protein
MSDERLHSIHLPFPRRSVYRERRAALLDARGWITNAAEVLGNFMGDEPEPAVVPEGKPATRYALMERGSDAAYPLNVGLNTIGRFPSNDIVLGDSPVSRRHCVILVHATSGCELHDTASTNGTFVNGQRVSEPVQLESGDLVQVCKRFFFLVCRDDYDAWLENGQRPDTVVA